MMQETANQIRQEREEASFAEVLEAAYYLLLAWDSDSGYRHYCGVGDDVSFPVLEHGEKFTVTSIAKARAVVEAARAEFAK